MNYKAQIFLIDALFLLIMICLFLGVCFTQKNSLKELEIIDISYKINDLLLVVQQLEIEDIENLEENYLKLFEKREGYVVINNNKKIINKNNKKYNNLISNTITYINSCNNKIYVEIGVYY